MVHYSLDTEPRRRVIFVLALSSLGLSYLLSLLLERYSAQFGAVSAFGVFAALSALFDRFLWRVWPGFGVPNLNGRWAGSVIRRAEEGEEAGRTTPVTLEITQTWTRIDVVFKSVHAISRAEVVGLFIENPDLIELCYGYQKRPSDGLSRGHDYSTGYTRLLYKRQWDKMALEGRYFSDDSRGGKIILSRR